MSQGQQCGNMLGELRLLASVRRMLAALTQFGLVGPTRQGLGFVDGAVAEHVDRALRLGKSGAVHAGGSCSRACGLCGERVGATQRSRGPLASLQGGVSVGERAGMGF